MKIFIDGIAIGVFLTLLIKSILYFLNLYSEIFFIDEIIPGIIGGIFGMLISFKLHEER